MLIAFRCRGPHLEGGSSSVTKTEISCGAFARDAHEMRRVRDSRARARARDGVREISKLRDAGNNVNT